MLLLRLFASSTKHKKTAKGRWFRAVKLINIAAAFRDGLKSPQKDRGPVATPAWNTLKTNLSFSDKA